MTTTRRSLSLLVAAAGLLAACGVVHDGEPGPASSPPSPSNAPPSPAPPATPFTYGSAAYYTANGQLVFVGLVERAGVPSEEETWAWRAGGWQQLHPQHEPEPPRQALLMADAATHQLIVQGGSYEPPAATGPTTQCGQAGCSVGTVSPVQQYDDTWVWDGRDWNTLSATGAPPVVHPSAYVDLPATHRLLASFTGPYPAVQGTYAWDGATWTRAAPATFPVASVAVDAGSGTAVGYEGQKAHCFPDPCAAPRSVTVLGDGITWHDLAGPEPEPEAGNMVSDPVDGGVLLLNAAGHTWVFRRGSWREAATTGPDPSVPGFLYTDGEHVYLQPEPGVAAPRWTWDGHRWQR